MINMSDVHVDVAVSNLTLSRKFYEEKLGLKVVKERDHEVYYKSGDSTLKIYQSQFAGTNKATSASWEVTDVKSTVAELKSSGISFENYDIPGVTHEGDVHIWGKVRAAWFRDPDGNIFCIGNGLSVE
jgi:catechol 2,3-dioxygenase-like lactoylglutathione lyase family enzyme